VLTAVFHEVRVPLNTALLALENLKGEGMFKDLNADTDDMVNGLVASLSMMEKVLNDVLSFNRMESGQFAQVYHPFNFHKSIQLVARSHRAQAAAAGIDFTVDLDPRISQLGKLVGDEMRLRQVTGNLVSNALKFTPAGSVQVVTSLIFPTSPSTDKRQVLSITEGLDRRLSTLSDIEMSAFGPKPKELIDPEKGDPDIETRRNSEQVASNQPSKVVIRVEVRDTGVGISGDDFEDDYRLFSPYVQTEIGRRQGGKGSGLGLALSRQIVELSGGRLGVDSQAGVGSTFW
jgi:signal transduction histidine kinase